MIFGKIQRTEQNIIPPKYDGFCCPICGSTEYAQIIKNNGIFGPGGRAWIDHCACKGCSIVFKDPKKFCKADKK